MNIKIYTNYEEMSKHACQIIIDQVKQNPFSVFVIPGGNTPARMVDFLVDAYKENKVSFKKCTFIGLDEWVGLGKENEGSCQHFLFTNLFSQIDVNPENLIFFDATSENLNFECEKIDKKIKELGGVDIMVLGIGLNGHLGFNEPGISFEKQSHIIDLDETTTSVGKKYFSENSVPNRGITLGIGNILDAKKILLLANGKEKSKILKKVVDTDPTEAIPATVLKLHKDAEVFLDEGAGQYLVVD
ncbi:glucosamine-6-phosphate deaminase [Bacillus sp. SG-1]|uniref:glucosamine-6-phosphate deaminase n=1 Tax=Bacillus sp. SG-1 TaxID=161544 RepID=UPI00015437A4|nr:glucosamine-6-phosphate deaminase [Bacillus sp. SG-1]EDL66558.1 glucosamine-6-phosphate deaminase [Bacillus sp. SG-1]